MAGGLLAFALFLSPPQIDPAAAQSVPTQGAAMSHAIGTFDVQITPIAAEADASAEAHGRLRIAKTFHGDIEGVGLGEMLAVRDGSSGAYVAMERVTGTIDGRSGGFSLVHREIMDAGTQTLLITIVPGSGSGDLIGVSGVFHLTLADGEHRYDLEYSLPNIAP